MGSKNVLLGLTTTLRSNWRQKIGEIKKYNIKEVSLFLTSIEKKERQELYKLLREIKKLNVFHVHLRGDMDMDELDYLAEQYDIKAFNIHSGKSKYPHPVYIKKYADIVYVENVDIVPEENELKRYGGLCVDFSHWEDARLLGNKNYTNKMEQLLPNYKIGCSHISAITATPHNNEDMECQGVKEYSTHLLNNLNEVDYIKRYIKYLPEIISIELENPFKEQLKIRNYLEKIINRLVA